MALVGLGMLGLVSPNVVRAFEGTLKLRSISVERTELGTLVEKPDPSPDAIFGLGVDKLLAFKGPPVPEIDNSTVYIRADQLRANAPLPDDQTGFVVVDIKSGTTRIVMPQAKRYIEWTAADGGALREQIDKTKKRLEAQLATLPPDQRQQAEAMLKEMTAMSEEGPPPVLEPLGTTRVINGFHTTGYQMRVGDQVTRGWVTQDLPDLARLYQSAQEKLQNMLPSARRDPRTAIGERGLPVLVQTLGPDRYRVEELLGVDNKPVAADLFTIPAEFTRTNGLPNAPLGPN